MHRLEHRRVGPGRVDIPTGRQADTATYRRGQIGDDVAEQVVGDDHVEATRVGDHVDGGGVDVLVGHLDVRVAFADLVDGPQPQSPAKVNTLILCTNVRCLRRRRARSNASATTRRTPNAVFTLTSVATSLGVPTRIAPPLPV